MPVDNVSTYALFQSTLKDISRVQSDLTDAQVQLSSGNSSQDFAGLGGRTQQFLSIDATLSRINRYLDNNKVIESRIDTTNSTLDQIIANVTGLQTLISSRRTGAADNSAFELQIESIWKGLAGQLNASVAGQYLFSGSKVDTPAVDAKNFPTMQVFGTPDDSYYTGGKQDLTTRPQDSSTMIYNVRADAPGFQKVFAGLAMAKEGDAQNSDQILSDAYAMVQAGLKDIVSIQATVNANKVTLGDIDKNHQSMKLYWQGLQESIANTDVLSVSTQVAVNQGILQAAFQVFAKINALRLSDYLK